ncbi:MAG: coproporphyrinogen III oxidase family protein [Saccharospirillaceae bacterium]|nr:coproporphyrinogen III oxidase family protein [Saccharospirillaceae bacterium]
MYSSIYPITYYFYPILETIDRPFLGDMFRQTLKSERKINAEAVLYIHIPYCQDLCRFCPFHVRVQNRSNVMERYVEALCKEIDLLKNQPYTSDITYQAVYFGGGSPSMLLPEQIEKLITHLKAQFKFTPDCEWSFEGEPNTLSDLTRLRLLKDLGITRISYGVQTFDPKMRDLLNINADLKNVDLCLDRGRMLGFKDINVDMMYNLPGQNLNDLHRDLNKLEQDKYDSIDYYNLHYFAFPKSFMNKMDKGLIPQKPSEFSQVAQYQEIKSRLLNMGYKNHADQHFSTFTSLNHFMRLLWGGGNGQHNAETVAIGASARGYLNGQVYLNHEKDTTYMKSIEEGKLPATRFSSPLSVPENRGALFGLKFFKIEKRFINALGCIPAEQLKSWVNAGLMYETEHAWHVSEQGKLWLVNMGYDIMEDSQTALAGMSRSRLEIATNTRTGSF